MAKHENRSGAFKAPEAAPPPSAAGESAELTELKATVERLSAENAALRDDLKQAVAAVDTQQDLLRHTLAKVAVPTALNVFFARQAREAEVRGDYVAHAEIAGLATATGTLRYRLANVLDKYDGELGQAIKAMHDLL